MLSSPCVLVFYELGDGFPFSRAGERGLQKYAVSTFWSVLFFSFCVSQPFHLLPHVLIIAGGGDGGGTEDREGGGKVRLPWGWRREGDGRAFTAL